MIQSGENRLEAVKNLEAGSIHPLLDEHLPQVVSV